MKGIKIGQITKNLTYTLISNIISTIISVIIVTVLPKFLSTSGYGYYQLFLFYTGYIGIMHFGWNDGIYLRNGGKYYDRLNKAQLFNQFWLQMGIQIFFACIGFILAVFFIDDDTKGKIFIIVMLYMVVSNLRVMLLYILQVTNRIKEYAITNVSGRIFVLFAVLPTVLVRPSCWYVIWIDFFGRAISLLIGCFYCRDIVKFKGTPQRIDWSDIKENITSGSKLMLSNLSAQLILGVIKLGVENNWPIEIFGNVSLAITASNMLMMFVNAVGLVIYPEMCRTSEETLYINYMRFQQLFGIISVFALGVYFPARSILNLWLPEYMIALEFMAVVFPSTIFEAKMSVLTSNTLKRFRKERVLLSGNFITLILAGLFTYICAFQWKNLKLTILLIPLLLAFRGVLIDLYLKKKYNFGSMKEMILEIFLVAVFIVGNILCGCKKALMIYCFSIVIYIIMQRKEIALLTKIYGRNR